MFTIKQDETKTTVIKMKRGYLRYIAAHNNRPVSGPKAYALRMTPEWAEVVVMNLNSRGFLCVAERGAR